MILESGEASFLGICSRAGVDWISRRTGSSDFIASAQKFVVIVNQTLKLARPLSPTRAPEPDPSVAERWISGKIQIDACCHSAAHALPAFFEDSFEHRLGLVQREHFESRMRSPPRSPSSDPGWYALRNAVYAIGSRLACSEDALPASYVVARDMSRKYLENALSVHLELLYMRTDSTAVEALLVMVGCPCSSALPHHLADYLSRHSALKQYLARR